MKSLVATLFCAIFGTVKAEPLDFLRLVKCVAEIEGASVDYVSPTGARGVFQLKEKTWAQYSQKPHEWANEATHIAQAETKRVALAHAHWVVEKAMPALKIPVNAYSFALLWGPGYGTVEKMHLTGANVDYARRFRNLYEADYAK